MARLPTLRPGGGGGHARRHCEFRLWVGGLEEEEGTGHGRTDRELIASELGPGWSENFFQLKSAQSPYIFCRSISFSRSLFIFDVGFHSVAFISFHFISFHSQAGGTAAVVLDKRRRIHEKASHANECDRTLC